MHGSHRTKSLQRHRTRQHADRLHAYDFFNQLTSGEWLDKVEGGLPHHRERLFPPALTLSIFMAQVLHPDASCQAAVNHHAIERMANGLPACSTHTGGYCKARDRLPLSLVTALFHHAADDMVASAPSMWRWRGRSVKLVDGSTVTMAYTPKNQACYPQISNQAPDLGFPIARAAVLLCLGTGTIMDTAIGPYAGKGGSEQALFYQMLSRIRPGDILIADRYYCSGTSNWICATSKPP